MGMYVGCGDIHVDNQSPKYRLDDYWAAVQWKLTWIVNFTNTAHARLLIAGDLFNSSRASTHVINVIMAILQKANKTPYCVAGQHDLIHHTDIEQTPIWNLKTAGVIRLLDETSKQFTGVSFENDIPTVENEFLIIHKCVTEKEPPFFLEDAVSAQDMMKEYPNYKYIISGDYHPAHYHQYKGRHLINVGTMMRNKKGMDQHVPCVWLIDTDSEDVERYDIPVLPYDEVFDLKAMAYDEKHGIEVDTTKLKKLMESDIDDIQLSDIIWQVADEFERNGHNPNKELIREALSYGQAS